MFEIGDRVFATGYGLGTIVGYDAEYEHDGEGTGLWVAKLDDTHTQGVWGGGQYGFAADLWTLVEKVNNGRIPDDAQAAFNRFAEAERRVMA